MRTFVPNSGSLAEDPDRSMAAQGGTAGLSLPPPALIAQPYGNPPVLAPIAPAPTGVSTIPTPRPIASSVSPTGRALSGPTLSTPSMTPRFRPTPRLRFRP